MLLIENDTTEIFWSYFDDIVDGLNIKHCEISKEHSNLILNVIKTFEKHPSIRKIKELNSGCRFSFENVSLEDVKNNVKLESWILRKLPNSWIFQLRSLSIMLIFFLNFSLSILIIQLTIVLFHSN